MGKHSLVKQSKQTFNKTLAIALAAGVSFGGVTVATTTEAPTANAVSSTAVNQSIISEDGRINMVGTKGEGASIIESSHSSKTTTYVAESNDTGRISLKSPLDDFENASDEDLNGKSLLFINRSTSPIKLTGVSITYGSEESPSKTINASAKVSRSGNQYVSFDGLLNAQDIRNVKDVTLHLDNFREGSVGEVNATMVTDPEIGPDAQGTKLHNYKVLPPTISYFDLRNKAAGNVANAKPNDPEWFNKFHQELGDLLTVKPGGTVSTGSAKNTQRIPFENLKYNLITPVPGVSLDEDTGEVTFKPRQGHPGGTEDVVVEVVGKLKTPDSGTVYYNAQYAIPFTVDGQPLFIESVKPVPAQGATNYEVKRSDGKTWTIDLADLNNRITDLEEKDSPSKEDFDKVKKDLDKAKDDIKDLKAGDDKLQDEIDKINDDLDKLTPRVDDLEDRVTDLENNGIKEVRDNGDGTYTIIRNNDEEVPGKIGDGQDIKELVPNEDGTLTIIRKDGSESKVDLKQVTITEENAGTPEHTVTITSPNGDTVTFNVFDKYVTNVVKNESGDYDIFRSDIDGGETVWKTIVLSDLRDKISNLEDRADKLEEKDQALQDEIDELKDRMGKAEDNIKGLQDKTEGLEDDVRKINAHLSTLDLRVSAIDAKLAVLEGRVDDLEDTNKKWAECYSGIGMAAIPLAIAAPLAGLANMDIPFLNQANTDIQKRLGVYNPDLAKAWGQYGGIMKAVAGLVGLMGAIGAITYAGNQCNPYNQTDDAKDTKLGQLSSKFESAKAESSSKK